MSDDRYVIPSPPKQEETQLSLHPRDQRRSNIAIVIAALAVLFTGFQAYEAHRARFEAQKALEIQAKTVERSRIAAEESADAANRSANAAWSGVNQLADIATTSKIKLQKEQRDLTIEQSPDIMQDNSTATQIAWGLKFDPTKSTLVNLGFHNSGKKAIGCTLKSGAVLAVSAKDIDQSDTATYPAVITLLPDTAVNFGFELPASPSLPYSAGDVRLFVYGSANCERSEFSDAPYRSAWCLSYPISKEGKVESYLHGCSD